MEREADRSRTESVEAVRSLLPRRAWHRVSVRLICETANVSRSTFYAHFDGKQDLLDLAFEALKGGLGRGAPDRGLDRHGSFCCVPELVAHMQSHLPLFERNRTSPFGPALFGQFRRVVDDVMREEIAASRFAGDVGDRRHDFLVGGVFGILERWCGDGCREPNATTILQALDEHVGIVLGGGGVGGPRRIAALTSAGVFAGARLAAPLPAGYPLRSPSLRRRCEVRRPDPWPSRCGPFRRI